MKQAILTLALVVASSSSTKASSAKAATTTVAIIAIGTEEKFSIWILQIISLNSLLFLG
jgi:hypothetical protein